MTGASKPSCCAFREWMSGSVAPYFAVTFGWMPALSGLMLLFAVIASGQPRIFLHKGVNFTAEGRGGYSSASALDMLRELPKYGVNSIALVPYGMTRQGAADIRFGGLERNEHIEIVAQQAHTLGMKVMLKPHIWMPGGFIGDLDFASDKEREAWFAHYRVFITHYARLAVKIRASVFCVGTELSKLSKHEKEWRSIILAVRKIYPGALTYAAVQGSEFETLAFWDALDYIGLNNYYPLPDDLSTSAVLTKVEAVQKKFRKPVMFPEAGFSSLEAPHREPWDETRRKLSMQDQARCYEAVYKAFWGKPWFKGIYWWKVGTDGFGGETDGSHTPWRKPAMDIVRRWYSR
jgi:hypothetical protein